MYVTLLLSGDITNDECTPLIKEGVCWCKSVSWRNRLQTAKKLVVVKCILLSVSKYYIIIEDTSLLVSQHIAVVKRPCPRLTKIADYTSTYQGIGESSLTDNRNVKRALGIWSEIE